MQIVRILIGMLAIMELVQPAFAILPFQILKTCMDGKAYNDKVTVNMLDYLGESEAPLSGCIDQSDFKFNGHTYGTLTCNDKFYLIINDKKIDPALAENFSLNPEIKPGAEFTPRSAWYKIVYEQQQYLCILAPLAEQGVGSGYNQYYIVRNAFDQKLNPELYFYFLDKNIAPITSKTL